MQYIFQKNHYLYMVVPFVNTAKLEKLEGKFLKIISY